MLNRFVSWLLCPYVVMCVCGACSSRCVNTFSFLIFFFSVADAFISHWITLNKDFGEQKSRTQKGQKEWRRRKQEKMVFLSKQPMANWFALSNYPITIDSIIFFFFGSCFFLFSFHLNCLPGPDGKIYIKSLSIVVEQNVTHSHSLFFYIALICFEWTKKKKQIYYYILFFSLFVYNDRFLLWIFILLSHCIKKNEQKKTRKSLLKIDFIFLLFTCIHCTEWTHYLKRNDPKSLFVFQLFLFLFSLIAWDSHCTKITFFGPFQ